jgi:hypothetical protein
VLELSSVFGAKLSLTRGSAAFSACTTPRGLVARLSASEIEANQSAPTIR